jgi:transaldolase
MNPTGTKIAMSENGLEAISRFADEGIKTNCTLIFTANQGLLAAKAGASLLSPFVGRLDDIATSGMELIAQIVEIFDNYEFPTEVLVASVRNPIHIVEAARMGADICTCPPAVIEGMFKHPLTDIGLEKFLGDWQSLKEELEKGA